MVHSHFRNITASLVLGATLLLSPAHAGQTLDGKAFQNVIRDQMSAFATGDAKTAFSFATNSLKERFRTPELFMEMVRQGYTPVYKPKNVTFGRSKMTKYGPTQEVFVTDGKGQGWVALYSFEQQEDGAWRISGCYITKSSGFAA